MRSLIRAGTAELWLAACCDLRRRPGHQEGEKGREGRRQLAKLLQSILRLLLSHHQANQITLSSGISDRAKIEQVECRVKLQHRSTISWARLIGRLTVEPVPNSPVGLSPFLFFPPHIPAAVEYLDTPPAIARPSLLRSEIVAGLLHRGRAKKEGRNSYGGGWYWFYSKLPKQTGPRAGRAVL